MSETKQSPADQTEPSRSNQSEFARRPVYFDGQLLDASDFHSEQQYARESLRSALVNLYGWGIARGLDVQWYSDSGSLSVTAGMALDRSGRVIVLPENLRVDLPEKSGVRHLYLTIRYAERETEYRRYEGEEALESVQGYTRIAELAQIDLMTEEPGEHGDRIELARLQMGTQSRSVERVDLDGRCYTRLIAGDVEAKRIDFLTVEDLPTDLKIDAWQNEGREGLVVHAPDTRFRGALSVDDSLAVGVKPVAPGDTSDAGAKSSTSQTPLQLAQAKLSVQASDRPAAAFGERTPLTISGDGPHLGFNASYDGLNWRGLGDHQAMARISLDSQTGDLSIGTSAAGAESGTPAALPDRLRIGSDGQVAIDAVPLVPAGRLIVGGPGGTSALFGSTNPLAAIYDTPGLGFNTYREDAHWKSITPGKTAGRLNYEHDGIVFAVQESDAATAAGAPIELRQRARIDRKGLEVAGDVNVSGNIATAHSGVITGARWQSIRPRVEVGNVLLSDSHFAKPQKFALPSEIPAEAVEVLVYIYVALRNNDKDQSVEISIYTEEPPNQFAQYLYLRNFEAHPAKSWKDWLENKPVYWHSTSSNFWMPVTQLRELVTVVTWYPRSVPLGAGEAMLFVTGWR